MAQMTTVEMVSVIIPVYEEGEVIDDVVRHIRDIAGDEPVEIIVSDGGPGYRTLAAITEPDVIRIKSMPGRGLQMNTAAWRASGDVLLFLHADTRLPNGAPGRVRRALEARAMAGAFDLAVDSDDPALSIVARFANLRSRLERVPYGDQAQFINAALFREMDGYAEIPVMEDVELFRRIRKKRIPIAILHEKAVTSPRRWEKEGVVKRTLTNWWLRVRYALGASPESLAKHYRPHSDGLEEA